MKTFNDLVKKKKFEKQKRYNALEFKFYDFDKQKFYSIVIKLNKDLTPRS